MPENVVFRGLVVASAQCAAWNRAQVANRQRLLSRTELSKIVLVRARDGVNERVGRHDQRCPFACHVARKPLRAWSQRAIPLFLVELGARRTHKRERSGDGREQRLASRALIGDLNHVQLKTILTPLVRVLTALRRQTTQIAWRCSQIHNLQRVRRRCIDEPTLECLTEWCLDDHKTTLGNRESDTLTSQSTTSLVDSEFAEKYVAWEHLANRL